MPGEIHHMSLIDEQQYVPFSVDNSIAAGINIGLTSRDDFMWYAGRW